MNAADSPANSALFGDDEHLSVSRALSELQARRPVRINAPGEVLFTLPVGGLDDQRLCEFVALCSPNAPELIVTRQRARAIGIEASTPMASSLSREVASEASIPLASGTAARFVVFRGALGVDQVAIIIGKPNFAEPIPVRLHSACLTGDVFGSRRCDTDQFPQRALPDDKGSTLRA
jgi:GTP cyclohydrolase II